MLLHETEGVSSEEPSDGPHGETNEMRVTRILRNPSCVRRKHAYLLYRARQSKGVPWWVLPWIRKSFSELLFLRDHATERSLLYLLETGRLSVCDLLAVRERLPVVRERIDWALQFRSTPPRTIKNLLARPDDWELPTVALMIADAAANGALHTHLKELPPTERYALLGRLSDAKVLNPKLVKPPRRRGERSIIGGSLSVIETAHA